MCTERSCQRGVTLIELIIFIVIVGVGLAGVLAVFTTTARTSADPFRATQALAIAEGLLSEVLTKNYADPDTVDNTTTPPTPGANQTETRRYFDAVEDFDSAATLGETQITTDATGTAWPTGYNAYVLVESIATFGPQATPAIPPLSNAYRVTVRIDYGGGQSLSLTGYRTNY